MKKIIIFIFLFSAGYAFAQPGAFGGHDSLLFDGNGRQRIYKTECYVAVVKSKGKVMGSRLEIEIIDICGEKDTMETYKWDDISEPDLTKIGDSIVTGADGFVTLMVVETTTGEIGTYKKKHTITMAPNSKLVIKDCDPYGTTNLFNGKTYIDGKLGGSMKFNVKTDISFSEPEGTVYSVEKSPAGDIIRVYEGAVTVKINKTDAKDIKDASLGIQQLNEDYKAGKITQEELIAKTKELSEKMQTGMQNMKVSVKVEAGNQVTVGSSIGTVIPIEGEDNWWEK
jgi:hypothetical protein